MIVNMSMQPQLFQHLENESIYYISTDFSHSLTFVFFAQRINFESDWKLITVFVGGNDICDHCYNSVSSVLILKRSY